MSSLLAGSRRLAGAVYRRCVGPLGVPLLSEMIDSGLPPHLAGPIECLLTGTFPAGTRAASDAIEQRRAVLAASPGGYRIVAREGPRGVERWPERVTGVPSDPNLTSRRLAHAVCVPRRWGMFLHLCANAVGARGILELGACLGISGAYLASAPTTTLFVTLEGSADLAAVARSTLALASARSVVLQGTFEGLLPSALALFADAGVPVDLVYLDGHHLEDATLRYVHSVIAPMSPGALIVLDDIYLCAEMWRAWQQVSSMPGVAVAIDLGRFGLIVRGEPSHRPSSFDLARFTGWWRIRRAKRPDA